MHLALVNGLGDLSLPKNSVSRLTDGSFHVLLVPSYLKNHKQQQKLHTTSMMVVPVFVVFRFYNKIKSKQKIESKISQVVDKETLYSQKWQLYASVVTSLNLFLEYPLLILDRKTGQEFVACKGNST